jgi:hypothetical protein
MLMRLIPIIDCVWLAGSIIWPLCLAVSIWRRDAGAIELFAGLSAFWCILLSQVMYLVIERLKGGGTPS